MTPADLFADLDDAAPAPAMSVSVVHAVWTMDEFHTRTACGLVDKFGELEKISDVTFNRDAATCPECVKTLRAAGLL